MQHFILEGKDGVWEGPYIPCDEHGVREDGIMGSLEARRVAEGDRDARADRRAFRPQAAAACGRYRIRGRTDAELVGRGEGYRPHIPVNDKSKRDDGTFSRSDFRYDPAD